MFRADRDLTPAPDGRTLLSPRGRERFAVARAFWLLVLGLLALALVLGLYARVRTDDIAGAEALALVQRRLDADRRAEIEVAQVHETLITQVEGVLLKDKSAPDFGTRANNLAALYARERNLVRLARKRDEIQGGFHGLTLLQEGNSEIALNATSTGRAQPETLAAYLHNAQAIASVLHAATRRAWVQAPRDPRQIVAQDVAAALAERQAVPPPTTSSQECP